MISFRNMDSLEVERRCHFYETYFLENKKCTLQFQNYNDPMDCSKHINSVIERMKFSVEDETLMEFERNNQMIPLDNFNWLKTSERACYWLWGCLRFSIDPIIDYRYRFDDAWLENVRLYDKLNFNCTPSSTSERFKLTLLFFDAWRAFSLIDKISYLERKKDEWLKINSSPDIFKWLNKDDLSQCEWVWKYILKSQQPDPPAKCLLGNSSCPSCSLNPLTHNEKYLASYASYDLWVAHKDTKKLFLKNINKAWSQKKLRDTREGKKPLNTYLKNETKRRLDELSQCYDMNKQGVLEMLINKEYENKK
ncbi:hypothetical protein GE191_05555 [Serratia fonticola]|uniref:hypothetical protein n=1 Tax=Serratia fonticola TaxID=47917 RepID=UPI0013769A94|nr:hypothetical protein [Serratia fonticola]NBJ33140.1 hypothetical protein [Serratia fonticola]